MAGPTPTMAATLSAVYRLELLPHFGHYSCDTEVEDRGGAVAKGLIVDFCRNSRTPIFWEHGGAEPSRSSLWWECGLQGFLR